jgi:hypothetical protein
MLTAVCYQLPVVVQTGGIGFPWFDDEPFAMLFLDVVNGRTFDVELGPVGEEDIYTVDIKRVVVFLRLIQSHAKTGGRSSPGSYENAQTFASAGTEQGSQLLVCRRRNRDQVHQAPLDQIAYSRRSDACRQ